VFFFRAGFVLWVVRIDRQRRAQPTVLAGKSTFSKAGQQESTDSSPIPLRGELEHRLAEFFFIIDVLHGVGLVDDIDQVS